MKCRKYAMLLIAATAGLAHAAEKLPAGVWLPGTMIELDIDASGRPSNLHCPSTVQPSICAVLITAAAKWQYAPGMQDGRATAMAADIVLTLRATKIDDAYVLHATDATMSSRLDATPGSPTIRQSSLSPPHYPSSELRRGRVAEAYVVLELWFQPGIGQPKAGKIWLNGAPADSKNHFVAAALDTIKKWRVNSGDGSMLSDCFSMRFNGPAQQVPEDLSPCKRTYRDGFLPPQLLTKPEEMVL
jgi:hypothetical protein